MLVTLKEIMDLAEEKECAAGAFNCTNLECIMAVIDAAEELKTPVILQYAELHSTVMKFDILAPIMVEFAKKSKVPVCVHFDHGQSTETCRKAVYAGFTSVMYDGSKLPLEENIRKTRQVVDAAHLKGVSVEGELGGMVFSDIADVSLYTDPVIAESFVKETQIDALAASFGTVHGVYLKKPSLDFDRLAEIRRKTGLPIVMHGGSGLSKEEYKEAIRNGVRKVNYYTYMAMAGGQAVRTAIESQDKQNNALSFHDLSNIAIEGMRQNVYEALKIFSMK